MILIDLFNHDLQKTRLANKHARRQAHHERERARRRKFWTSKTPEEQRSYYDKCNEKRRKKRAERRAKHAAQKDVGYTVVGVEPVNAAGEGDRADAGESAMATSGTVIEETGNTVEYIRSE